MTPSLDLGETLSGSFLTRHIARSRKKTHFPASNRATDKSILTVSACQTSRILAKVRQVALWLARGGQK
jgi:hypothetical protein